MPAGEGRVPVGCWVGTVRDGPDFDMGVFASDNEEEPPVCEVRGGVGFRHGDPRLGFLGMSSDSDAILDGEDANLRLLPMMLWSWTVILNLQWIWTQITPQTSMLGVKKAEDLVWGRYVVVGGMSPSFSPQIHPEPKGS